jgi:phosphate transport system substrate-binding protein
VLGRGGEARRDITASADDDVIVQAVARDTNGLGYVPFSYYWANRARLKAVAISQAPGGQAVAPTLEAIARGQYQPLSRPLFLYVSAKSLERPEVKSFAELYVQRAGATARTLDYVPLTEDLYRVALDSLRRGTAGTRWAGSVPVGLTQESLQKSLGQL